MDQSMRALMERMAKSRSNPGYVVFVKHRSMPLAQPTREEAVEAARGMLTNPVFTQAWTVGRDGIREVSRWPDTDPARSGPHQHTGWGPPVCPVTCGTAN